MTHSGNGFLICRKNSSKLHVVAPHSINNEMKGTSNCLSGRSIFKYLIGPQRLGLRQKSQRRRKEGELWMAQRNRKTSGDARVSASSLPGARPAVSDVLVPAPRLPWSASPVPSISAFPPSARFRARSCQRNENSKSSSNSTSSSSHGSISKLNKEHAIGRQWTPAHLRNTANPIRAINHNNHVFNSV